MKEINFRIIELDTHQVLLEKDFDNEKDDGNYLLNISFYYDGAKVFQGLTFTTEEKRNAAFDKFSDNAALELVKSIENMFK